MVLTESLAARTEVAPPRLRRSAVALGILLALGGCVAPIAGGNYPGVNPIKVDGRFLPPAQALEALRANAKTQIAQITPEPNPIADSVRVVVADHDRLRPLAIQFGKTVAPGPVEFLAELIHGDELNVVDVIRQSRLFRTVTVVEQNDTVAPDPGGAQYLLWYRVASIRPNNAGPWIGQWQIRRSNSPMAAPVGADLGTPAGVPRLASIARSVRAAVTGQLAPAGGSTGTRLASNGSGIVIDSQGHIITNNHVVAGCPDLRVLDTSAHRYPATLVNADAANDLALLATHQHFSAWASFRESHGLRPGESLVATGFPLTGLVSSEMAVTTGSLTALAGERGDTRHFQFSAPVQPGNSGGPVLDESGRVVGVAVTILNGLVTAAMTGAVAQNVNFAIKSDLVREFLDANHISPDSGSGHPGLSAPIIADQARRFTVKVECWR